MNTMIGRMLHQEETNKRGSKREVSPAPSLIREHPSRRKQPEEGKPPTTQSEVLTDENICCSQIEEATTSNLAHVDTQQPHSHKRKQKRPELVIRCSPRRFKLLVDSLDENKRSAISEIEFGGLLDIKCTKIPYECIWIVKNFDPELCQLKINENRVLPITSGDIASTFGIPGNGPLPGSGIAQNNSGGSEIPSKIKLCELLEELKSMPPNNDFKKKFVIFVCGCLLSPDASLSARTGLWNILEPVEQISSFNWAEYVRLNLCSTIKAYHSKKRKYIGGCVLFLMIFYLNQVAAMNDPTNMIMPQLEAWTDDAIRRSLKKLIGELHVIDSVTSEGQQQVLHVADEDQSAEDSQQNIPVSSVEDKERKMISYVQGHILSEELVVIGNARARRLDLQSLFLRKWISNSVVDIVGSLWNAADSTPRCPSYILPSHFASKLEGCRDLDRLSSEQLVGEYDWLLEPLRKYNLFLAPSCSGNHWLVYAIDLVKRRVDILDSKRHDELPNKHVKMMIDRLCRVISVVLIHSYGPYFDMSDFKVAYAEVPRPSVSNSDNCGIYAMKYMEFWDGNKIDFDISEENVDAYRFEYIVRLMMAESNRERGRIFEKLGISI